MAGTLEILEEEAVLMIAPRPSEARSRRARASGGGAPRAVRKVAAGKGGGDSLALTCDVVQVCSRRVLGPPESGTRLVMPFSVERVMKRTAGQFLCGSVAIIGLVAGAQAQIKLQPTSAPTVTADNESWYQMRE